LAQWARDVETFPAPGSVSGFQFKREPSFELEIREPDHDDLNDLTSREPEPEPKSLIEWGKSREYYSIPYTGRRSLNISPHIDVPQ